MHTSKKPVVLLEDSTPFDSFVALVKNVQVEVKVSRTADERYPRDFAEHTIIIRAVDRKILTREPILTCLFPNSEKQIRLAYYPALKVWMRVFPFYGNIPTLWFMNAWFGKFQLHGIDMTRWVIESATE